MSTQDVFGGDELQRRPFVERVTRFVKGLGDQDVLPASRVLAIDAPWGSGKSWVATRLVDHFKTESEITSVYINAFEFDFHHDPFAVLLSAVLDAAKRETRVQGVLEELKSAGRKVITGGAPLALKTAITAAGSAMIPGGLPLINVISEAIGEASKEALRTYEDVRKSHESFRNELRKLAESSGNHFVIIVDELDRCRPTFALEMLERIKHLFDVPRVVFVLALHKIALEAAVRHTYGNEIDAGKYLRKFISLEIPLPSSLKRSPSAEHRAEFFRSFLQSRFGNQSTSEEFFGPIAQLAPYFDATLRDIEYIVLLSRLAPNAMRQGYPAVYAILLWLFDRVAFEAAKVGGYSFAEREHERLASRGVAEYGIAPLMAQAFASHLRHADPQNRTGEHLQIMSALARAALDLDLGQMRF